MSTKIEKLVELEKVLSDKEKIHEGVLSLITSFKINRFLTTFNLVKSKGISVSILLVTLIIFRLKGESISRIQTHPLNFLPKIDDNTFYRLLNNPLMNWRKLLLGFAKQFAVHIKEKSEQNTGKKCFVIDDTDLEKTGKTIEFVSRIFNHVSKRFHLGFKMLLLSYWDGKSLISVDFSLHREKGRKGNYGLTKKEKKGQFSKKRDQKSPSISRIKELDKKKTEVAISMLKRAVKNGFEAAYVLMDSWFINDYIIKSIRSIKNASMHVLGMCKIDKRKYSIEKKELNAHQLIVRYERKRSKYSRKYKSHYIPLAVNYKGEIVRLFFIRYNNSKNRTLILTTDLNLSFVQAIEIYQIRWTIEVLFKECKQYLHLGCIQNTDFDGQIADITLTLITHTILTLQKRFHSYETMGELFRETQLNLIELTLWERIIKLFLKMILLLIDILDVEMEEVMNKIMQNNDKSYKLIVMMTTLLDSDDKSKISEKNAIELAMAS